MSEINSYHWFTVHQFLKVFCRLAIVKQQKMPTWLLYATKRHVQIASFRRGGSQLEASHVVLISSHEIC